MRFYLQDEGGKEPGLIIHGTKEDITKLAHELSHAVENAANDTQSSETFRGLVHTSEVHVTGCSKEWFAFKVVSTKTLDSLFSRDARAYRIRSWLEYVLAVIIIATLFCAARGIQAFIWG